jgi:rhomboid protease GluP
MLVVTLARGGGLWDLDPQVHADLGSNFAPLTATGEPWRLVTNLFIHFGLLHFAVNMWTLFDAGRIAERLYGSFRFSAIYLIAGIAGSVATIAWNPVVNSAGASGALFGTVGALLAFVLDRRNGVPRGAMRRVAAVLGVFVAIAFGFGFINPHIDNAAHLGGLVVGAVVGLLLARPLGGGRMRSKGWLATGLVALMIAGVAIGALGRAEALVETKRLQGLLAVIGRHQAGLDALTEQTIVGVRRQQLAPTDGAARLRQLAGMWRHDSAEIAALPLAKRSRYTTLYGQLKRYTALRADALDAFAQSLEKGDPASLARAQGFGQESLRLRRAINEEVARLDLKPPAAAKQRAD